MATTITDKQMRDIGATATKLQQQHDWSVPRIGLELGYPPAIIREAMTVASGDEPAVSKRKPHNHIPGYVAERVSKHPKLPGHFVIYDRNKGFEIDADERWIVMHEPSSAHIAVKTLAIARSIMYAAAEGGNEIDFGQNSDQP